MKLKIKVNACAYVQLCIKALEICHNRGLIPLDYKGYAISWTLQNPYLTRVPKLGIEVREYPQNSIGLEIVKKAEELVGIKSTQGSTINNLKRF